jgi:hypothetical protein
VKRLGDPTGDELQIARRLWTLAAIHPTLAVLEAVMLRRLPRE